MTPDQIFCRLCRKSYSVEDGCDICSPAKHNILWPSVTPETTMAPVQLCELAVERLRVCYERLEVEMNSSPLKNKPFHPDHAKAAVELAKAVSTVSGEYRRAEKHHSEGIARLPFEDKLKLMHKWFKDLPHRRRVEAISPLVRLLQPPKAAEWEEAEIVK